MADDKDYIKGWTIQQGGEPDAPERVPGNVITADELPNIESLRAAGVDEDQYFANLVIAVDEDEKRAILGEDEPKAAEVVEEAPAEEPADEAVADDEEPAEDDAEAEEPAAE